MYEWKRSRKGLESFCRDFPSLGNELSSRSKPALSSPRSTGRNGERRVFKNVQKKEENGERKAGRKEVERKESTPSGLFKSTAERGRFPWRPQARKALAYWLRFRSQ